MNNLIKINNNINTISITNNNNIGSIIYVSIHHKLTLEGKVLTIYTIFTNKNRCFQ